MSSISYENLYKAVTEIAERAMDINLYEAHNIDYDFRIRSGTEVKGMKHALGWCSYRNKEICLNADRIEYMKVEALADTILHEIAHAIAYHLYGDSGHGKHWKMVCRWLGCDDMAKKVISEEYFTEDFVAASRNEVEKKEKRAKWLIVKAEKDENGNIVDLVEVSRCHRRMKNLGKKMVSDDRSTLGKLYMLESKYEGETLGNKIGLLTR